MALPKALKSGDQQARIAYLLSNWSTFTTYLTSPRITVADVEKALTYERTTRNRETFVSRLEGRLIRMRRDAKSAT